MFQIRRDGVITRFQNAVQAQIQGIGSIEAKNDTVRRRGPQHASQLLSGMIDNLSRLLRCPVGTSSSRGTNVTGIMVHGLVYRRRLGPGRGSVIQVDAVADRVGRQHRLSIIRRSDTWPAAGG